MSSEGIAAGTMRVMRRAVAWPWEIAFAVHGRLTPTRAPVWSSPGGLRVLVVAPHPDDEVAGCGGTLLLHRDRGDSVTVCWVTDGRRSRALGMDPDSMARRRRHEAHCAARALDVETLWIGLPEGGWTNDKLVSRLARVLASTDPDLIYAPSRVDFHPEHRRVAVSLAHAMNGAADRVLVRAYQVHVPLGILTNRIAPTGPVADRVRLALECYRTQLGSLRRTGRMKRYAGRRHCVGGNAEPFWEMAAPEYVALHPTYDAETAPVFRGVRPLPVTDPLAYLWGTRERSRLAAEAHHPRGPHGAAP